VAKVVAELLIRVIPRESGAPVPIVHLSQSQIAEMVRLSRQTVNKGLKILEERGLVQAGYNKIEIRDERALRESVFF
jgi:CRP/FNR family transcriptional regulator, cyclic AMP receptor protein